MINWTLSNLELVLSEISCEKDEETSYYRRKTFANLIFNKGQVSRIYKEPSELNIKKKINNSNERHR